MDDVLYDIGIRLQARVDILEASCLGCIVFDNNLRNDVSAPLPRVLFADTA